MRFNYNPESVVFFDMETQSAVSLPTLGSHLYLTHPSTRMMSCVVTDADYALVWLPRSRCKYQLDTLWPKEYGAERRIIFCDCEDIPEELCKLVETNVFVAHNAEGFDAMAWDVLVNDEFSPQWYDTMPVARSAGFPGSLDALSRILTGRGKHEEGKQALKLLYTAKIVKGTVTYPVGTQPLWAMMTRYNIADCIELEQVFHAVYPYTESEILNTHSAINRRGIQVDVEYAEQLRDLWSEQTEAAYEEVSKRTTIENIRSGPQVKEWLMSKGCAVDSLDRKLLEQLYDDPENFFEEDTVSDTILEVIEILKLRQQATRTSSGKLKRLRESVSEDGRLRNAIVYCGAVPTGRFSSRGVQLHNMPRGISGFNVGIALHKTLTLDRVKRLAWHYKSMTDDVLATLFRTCFHAREGHVLAIADYAAIEARGIAWIAGEEKMLQVFASDGDVYLEMASSLYGRTITKHDKGERFLAKQIVLGCGYQMGGPKFEKMCVVYRINLDKVGLTGKQCVEAYRRTYSRIPRVWHDVHNASLQAMRFPHKEFYAGRTTFTYNGSALHARLPSGRVMVYRAASVAKEIPGYLAILGRSDYRVDVIRYTHPHGMRKALYGGILCENIVQGLSCDILKGALIRLERAGILPVLHVHDEPVCEVEGVRDRSALSTMVEIMTDVPDWAGGFPLKAEGFVGERYTKGVTGKMYQCEALNGKLTKEYN